MIFRRRQQIAEQTYKEAFQSFFRICMRYCNSRPLAEEIFNDGMIKYFEYERKNKIDPDRKYALIKKIIVNTCIDHVRKNKLEFTELTIEQGTNDSGLDHIVYQEMKEELFKVVSNLAPQTKVIFNLFVFEGWTHSDIAKKFGISENTSYWHVSQGKKKAMELFQKNVGLR
jgi:RNA polymerase sigma-70 factor (ECF subfamily)